MPASFSDFGVRCRNCGKFINLFTPTLPTLSDPFRATCPYCETTSDYEKSAVHHVSGLKRLTAKRALLLAAIQAGVILLLGVLYATR
jgi:hypothetical protein